jgi:hypothetical protein
MAASGSVPGDTAGRKHKQMKTQHPRDYDNHLGGESLKTRMSCYELNSSTHDRKVYSLSHEDGKWIITTSNSQMRQVINRKNILICNLLKSLTPEKEH